MFNLQNVLTCISTIVMSVIHPELAMLGCLILLHDWLIISSYQKIYQIKCDSINGNFYSNINIVY